MENKKKPNVKLIILIVIIVAIILAGPAAFILQMVVAYQSFRAKQYQKTVEIEYAVYVQAMGGLDWSPERDPDFVPDDREVAMRLAYYNYKKECTLTQEELMSQFATSKTTREGNDDLRAFTDFATCETWLDYDETFNSCKSCCRQILTESGIDPDGATTKEVTEAFFKTIAIETYMEENGYGRYDESNVVQQMKMIEQVDEIYTEFLNRQAGVSNKTTSIIFR